LTEIQSVIKSIYVCCESDFTITIVANDQSHKHDPLQHALEILMQNRKEIAKLYTNSFADEDNKNELLQLFSKYNENIIQLLGLHTLSQS
jgi:precorrin-3B methylase